MTKKAELDFEGILCREEVPLEDFLKLRTQVYSSLAIRNAFEKFLEQFEKLQKSFSSENKWQTRKGVCLWILGKTEEAIETLSAVRTSKESLYFLGTACLEAGRSSKAVEAFEGALETDRKNPHILTALANAFIHAGKNTEALELLQKNENLLKDNARFHYLLGLAVEFQGNRDEAMKHYDAALAIEPENAETIFRQAFLHALYGNEDAAVQLYEKLRKLRPPRVNVLLNLSVIYEDRGNYKAALECLETVLDVEPNNERARLFMSDVLASQSMYYDEEMRRREHKWLALVNRPVTDLLLSVRSRNVLKKLAIHTIGDLISKSAEELLAHKNFGDISLREIENALAERGLALAQPGEEPQVRARLQKAASGSAGVITQTPEDIMKKPLSDFDWPARVRSCFEELRLETIGQLVTLSEKDLTSVKNFGKTSLNIIKQRLAQIGLALRPG